MHVDFFIFIFLSNLFSTKHKPYAIRLLKKEHTHTEIKLSDTQWIELNWIETERTWAADVDSILAVSFLFGSSTFAVAFKFLSNYFN